MIAVSFSLAKGPRRVLSFITAIFTFLASIFQFGGSSLPGVSPLQPALIQEEAPIQDSGVGQAWRSFWGTVAQGDRLRIEESQCTLGFIERIDSQLYGYTAAHCGADGSVVSLVRYGQAYPIGTLKHYSPKGVGKAGSDVALIDFYPQYDRASYRNNYTSNRIVPFSEISVDDRVCMYSRQEDRTRCGGLFFYGLDPKKEDIESLEYIHTTYDYDLRYTNTVTFGAHGEYGDSGSPVWIPGKGIIGVFTSIDTFADLESRQGSAVHIGLLRNSLLIP